MIIVQTLVQNTFPQYNYYAPERAFFKGLASAPHPHWSTAPVGRYIIEVEYLCPEKGNNTGWRTGFIAADIYMIRARRGKEDKMRRIFWSAGQPLFVYIKFETRSGTPQPESFNIHRLLFAFNVSSGGGGEQKKKKIPTHATRATTVGRTSTRYIIMHAEN
jgi:hypothetical protein